MFYSNNEMRKYRIKKALYLVSCSALVAVAEFVLIYLLLL